MQLANGHGSATDRNMQVAICMRDQVRRNETPTKWRFSVLAAVLSLAFSVDARAEENGPGPLKEKAQAPEHQTEHKGRPLTKPEWLRRFLELDKSETGAFWNCITADAADGMLVDIKLLQQQMESAYFNQQDGFAEYLTEKCLPKITGAQQKFAGLRGAPAEIADQFDRYQASLSKLEGGLRDYAAKVGQRAGTRDVYSAILKTGQAWHASAAPTPGGVAFEHFLYCAVPGLAKMKDAQELLEFLADQCFKQSPVAFMSNARAKCGDLVMVADKEARVDLKSVPTWRNTHKRFFEDDARQLEAWDSCGKRARKGQREYDIASFLSVAGQFLNTRARIARAAQDAANAAQ